MLEEWFESEQEGTTSGFLILGTNTKISKNKNTLCAQVYYKQKIKTKTLYASLQDIDLFSFHLFFFFFSRGRVIVGLLLVASVKHRRIPKVGFAIPKFDSKILIALIADQRDIKWVTSCECAYGTRSAH